MNDWKIIVFNNRKKCCFRWYFDNIYFEVESFAKHVNDIVHDYRCLKNGVIGFTETQMKPLDSTSITDDTLKDFNMNFNNNDNKFQA